MNTFENDRSHISTKYLLRLTARRGLMVEHLFRVTHRGTGAYHVLAVLPENDYICDCCMGLNIGLPCRHYFQVLSAAKTLRFDLGKVVRARWFQDPNTPGSELTPVTRLELGAPSSSSPNSPPGATATATTASEAAVVRLVGPAQVNQQTQRGDIEPDPSPQVSSTASTQTLPARTIFHETQMAIKPLLTHVQTQRDLDELLSDLEDLRTQRQEDLLHAQIRDPPTVNPKGRPRTMRLTAINEGRPRGGGANIAIRRHGQGAQVAVTAINPQRKCTICRDAGHNRSSCPFRPQQ